MIDIHQGSFTAVPDQRVPQRNCVIVRYEKPIYAGSIKDSIDVQTGDKMYLNPADFKRIGEWLRKKMH